MHAGLFSSEPASFWLDTSAVNPSRQMNPLSFAGAVGPDIGGTVVEYHKRCGQIDQRTVTLSANGEVVFVNEGESIFDFIDNFTLNASPKIVCDASCSLDSLPVFFLKIIIKNVFIN